MTDLTIAMPAVLQDWVDAKVAEGAFADAGDYVRDLVRRDREVADREWLRAMIAEGLASGVVDAEPEEVLAEIMSRLPNG